MDYSYRCFKIYKVIKRICDECSGVLATELLGFALIERGHVVTASRADPAGCPTQTARSYL